MTTTSILLVRHAHAHRRPDEARPLSAEGRAAAERVADLLVPQAPVAIYSSPYARARETVEPLSERLGLPIVEMEELRERSLGLEFVDDWPAEIRPTWEDFSLAYPTGGESNNQVAERAGVALERLQSLHAGQTIVVATHGNLLVLLLRQLDPSLGFDFWRTLTLPDIYRLDVASDGGFRLRRVWKEDHPS